MYRLFARSSLNLILILLPHARCISFQMGDAAPAQDSQSTPGKFDPSGEKLEPTSARPNQQQNRGASQQKVVSGNWDRNLGIWLILASTILWSLSGLFTQLPQLQVWQAEYRGIYLAFWRALFALVILLPLVRRVSWNWKMVPMVLSFALMNLSFLTAMVVGSPANAIWLQYLAPSWVMLGSVVLFRESTTRADWTMLALCTSGVLFILVMESFYAEASPSYRWWAPALGLVSGIFYAGVILSIRSLKAEDPAWLATLNHAFTALLVAPILILTQAAIPSGSLWLVLAGIGMIQMGLPYFLFAHGLKTTPSHIAALITLVEPVILPFWVHCVRYADPTYDIPPWWTWCGAGLILTGLLFRYFIRTSKKSVV